MSPLDYESNSLKTKVVNGSNCMQSLFVFLPLVQPPTKTPNHHKGSYRETKKDLNLEKEMTISPKSWNTHFCCYLLIKICRYGPLIKELHS